MHGSKTNEEILTRAVVALTSFLESSIGPNIETLRIVRVLGVLSSCGCSTRTSLFGCVLDHVIQHRQSDGGWSDPEETAWALGAIKVMQGTGSPIIPSAIEWLKGVRYPVGGWGRHLRDRPRIPITGLLLYLLPEFADQKAVNWLKKEWQKDFEGTTRLTYKGAFFLLGLSTSGVSGDDYSLIKDTYSFLHDEQNEDGGFGPWKDHPIGSEPWSTGIVLLGLLSYPYLVKRDVIERAVNWLVENQLSNGLWAYHYIEEGSAYAYWGLVEALKFLSRESN